MASSPPAKRPVSFRYALGLSVLAAGLYLALIIGIFGFLSLITQSQVITEPDAGTLLGPTMSTASSAVLIVGLTRLGYRSHGQFLRLPVFRSLIIGFAAYFAFVVTGGALYAAKSGILLRGIIFVSNNAFTWFSAAVFIVAAAIALGYFFLLLRRN